MIAGSNKKRNDLRAHLERLGYTAGSKRIMTAAELQREQDARKREAPTRPKAPPKATVGPARRRQAPEAQSGTRSTPPIHYGRAPLTALPTRARGPSAAPDSLVCLEETVEGAVTHRPEGTLFVSTHPVCDVQGACDLDHRFAEMREDAAGPVGSRLLAPGAETIPALDSLVFMDIETTGLSSSPLFLIGVMVWRDGGFQIDQYFARNYAEEPAVVASFADVCRDREWLITFNGKTFDMPYIRSRATANRLPMQAPPLHLDLLHESRRIWRGRLPNCKLQTLEKHVCGRTRRGDIPGSEIPDAYHQFVRSSNAVQMVEVLKHNLLDLVTLADLMTRMPCRP